MALLVVFLVHTSRLAGAADDKTIWQAAADGDVGALKIAAKAGADVNAQDKAKGQTPLFHAITAGKSEAVKALLDAGADPSVTSRKGHPPLAFAAERGELEAIRLLAKAGADLNAAPPPAYVPLGHAALENKLEAMKLLLDLGADVNAENRAGLTALFSAAARGHRDAVKLLLKRGADVDHTNNDGLTAVSAAAYGGDVEVLKLLVAAGGDAADANEGSSATSIAAKRRHRQAVLFLLDNGADVNWDSNFERSLLAIACGRGDATLARELLKRGAKLQTGDELELKEALLHGHAECAQILVDQGAKLTLAEQKELTGQVGRAGHFDAFRVLLRAGRAWNGVKSGAKQAREDALLEAARAGDAAKVKATLDGGVVDDADVLAAALKFAEVAGKKDAIDLLRPLAGRAMKGAADKDSVNEKLTEAAGKGDIKRVKELLDAGADADAHDVESGVGALHAAAEKGHAEVVKMLIGRGAKLNASRGYVQYTPLRSAVSAGKVETVKLLLKAGADPNAPSGHFSPLASAAFEGKTQIVQLLLDAGADIDYRGNAEGRTAIMWAAERGKNEMVELLAVAGADLSLKDEHGATAIAIAEAAANQQGADRLRVLGGTVDKRAPLSVQSLFDQGPEGVKRWLQRGGDPKTVDPGLKQTPFQYAVGGPLKEPKASEIARLLLERSPDLAKQPGVVSSAVYAGRGVPFLKLLVEHGADVNGKNSRRGYTPLLLAAQYGTVEQVEYLLSQGADRSARLDTGDDAVALATKAKNKKVVELLNKAKAGPPAEPPPRKP
jgi:ankyrin repeat protein